MCPLHPVRNLLFNPVDQGLVCRKRGAIFQVIVKISKVDRTEVEVLQFIHGQPAAVRRFTAAEADTQLATTPLILNNFCQLAVKLAVAFLLLRADARKRRIQTVLTFRQREARPSMAADRGPGSPASPVYDR